MDYLKNPVFQDESAARAWLEARVWPNGPVCPHCGDSDFTKLEGKAHRPGLYQCNACRQQFTVTVGTVFERSKIPLTKWLLATFLLSASKKGMSAHQLHRMLGVSYKSTWFMMHRIREAMKDDGDEPLGGNGKAIEADETFFGSRGYEFTTGEGWQAKPGMGDKGKVLTLVERRGRARSVKLITITSKEIRQALVTNANRKATLITDEANYYKTVGKEFARHRTVNHSKHEYGRGMVHTNTVEGFFSIFKRGMIGTYQHCGEQHLQRYLTEFDFRYSHRKTTDFERTGKALEGIVGKRLTYRRSRLLTEA